MAAKLRCRLHALIGGEGVTDGIDQLGARREGEDRPEQLVIQSFLCGVFIRREVGQIGRER